MTTESNGTEIRTPKPAEVKFMRVDDLAPCKDNPRTISAAAFKRVKSSLLFFGQVGTVGVWNDRTHRLVGGHQRIAALKAMGVERAQVAIVDVDAQQEVAMRITLNNPAAQGRFHAKRLKAQTEETQAMLPDLAAALGIAEANEHAEDAGKGSEDVKFSKRKGTKIDARVSKKAAAQIEASLDKIAELNGWELPEGRAQALVAVFDRVKPKDFAP